MKVIEHLERATEPLISFEVIPPLRGGKVDKLLNVIDDLVEYKPPFIDITSHQAQVVYEENRDGSIQRRIKRKRPGTLGVCALLQNKYNIDAVPHILCRGFSREETEDFLIELAYLGIDNVLAVRGDDSGYQKPMRHGRSANAYASDLVAQIHALRAGRYLEESLLDAEPLDFCIGVGGYPERHFECPNLDAEVRVAKVKEDAGADYVVTQMFFENAHYFRYVELCRAAGVTIPIIPGLKILTTKNHLVSIPRNFYAEIPASLADEVTAAKAEDVTDIGVEWALAQTQELMEKGVPSVHFYIMQTSRAIKQLLGKLKR